MDIERALGRALDADDPGPAFTGKVIAAVKAAGAAPPVAVSRTGARTILLRAVLPIAATVALVTAGVQWRASQAEEAKARTAHAQLVQALRLTGEKLNVVHRAIERSQE